MNRVSCGCMDGVLNEAYYTFILMRTIDCVLISEVLMTNGVVVEIISTNLTNYYQLLHIV